MKTATNLLSKLLIILHYPADIGGFVFFYLCLRQFAQFDLIPRLAVALCLGAAAVLISGVFHSIWASDYSARYLLYAPQEAQMLDVLSLIAAILPAVVVGVLMPVNFWTMMRRYVEVLAAVFVLRALMMLTLPYLVVRMKDCDESRRYVEPKMTLAEIIESVRQTECARASARRPVQASPPVAGRSSPQAARYSMAQSAARPSAEQSRYAAGSASVKRPRAAEPVVARPARSAKRATQAA